MVGRWVVEAFMDEDAIGRVLVVVIVLALGGLIVFNAASTVYLNPQHSSNKLVQHGQPNDDLDPLVSQFDAAAETENIDVLFYGNTSSDTSFVRPSASQEPGAVHANLRPICTNWPEPMPLNWYLANTGVNATCAESLGELRFLVEQQQPTPDMVVVRTDDESVPRQLLRERYGEPSTYSLRSNDRKTPRALVYAKADLDSSAAPSRQSPAS
jgi:predicted membrane-bound mannosyltransferase